MVNSGGNSVYLVLIRSLAGMWKWIEKKKKEKRKEKNNVINVVIS